MLVVAPDLGQASAARGDGWPQARIHRGVTSERVDFQMKSVVTMSPSLPCLLFAVAEVVRAVAGASGSRPRFRSHAVACPSRGAVAAASADDPPVVHAGDGERRSLGTSMSHG